MCILRFSANKFEAIDPHFGDLFFLACFGFLGAIGQGAFDGNALAFADVLFDEFGLLAPEH